jgi:hypothetical protein
MNDGLQMVETGVCSTWPLPADPTCAGIARRMFRRAADGLVFDQAVADDGMSMVSELAANTLHAPREQLPQSEQYAARQEPRAHTGRPAYTTPELWLYLRGAGQGRELVCKVFDTFPGWLRGNVPGRGQPLVPADAMSGRGLDVVHELSNGRWGHHLTRARLAGFRVRGKAVWFAVPAPEPPDSASAPWPPGAPGAPGAPGYLRMSASEAMTDLEKGLAARGFGGTMVRADDPAGDMAVLSVCSSLTVWCRRGRAWLRVPGRTGIQWSYGDLVEVAEQTVAVYETLAYQAQPAPYPNATWTGALTHVLPRLERTSSSGSPRAPGRYAAPAPRSGLRRSQSPRVRSE